MKFNAALAKSLLMAASIGTVMPVLAQSSAKKAAPKKEAAPAEPEITIPGTVITRADGTFLSLTLDGGNFKLAFYGKDKKQVPPDAARATARWNPVNKKGDERSVLNAEGDVLKGNKRVLPPYVFKVYITLLSADDTAIESVVADFRG